MLARLALLFTVIPLIELVLLLTVGARIGILGTVLLILATGLTGAWLARWQGMGVLRTMQAELQSGQPPAKRIVEGLLVLAGALLLLTPGILTDITGFTLILPFTRRLLGPPILRMLLTYVLGRPEWAAALNLSFASEDASPRPSKPDTRGEANPTERRTPFDHPVR